MTNHSGTYSKTPLLLLFLLILFSCKVSETIHEQEIEDSETTTLELQDIQNVEGTKLSMHPPMGFSKAHNFTGFQQDESGSSIMIVQFPADFEVMKSGLTPEKFKTQGVIIDSTKDIQLNNVDMKKMEHQF